MYGHVGRLEVIIKILGAAKNDYKVTCYAVICHVFGEAKLTQLLPTSIPLLKFMTSMLLYI
jgi:hypothetical protein